MNENPWGLLPASPPYVLPDDAAHVRAFNKKVGQASNHFLHIDRIVPEPFVGDKKARVVLLSNNPGLSDKESSSEYYSPSFMDKMRMNLRHEPANYPFLFIASDHTGRGRQWWDRKLKCLLMTFLREIVARSILNVTYFPYPSRNFGHSGLGVPSQRYSFSLVQDAVKRGAVVVLMRREGTLTGREKCPNWRDTTDSCAWAIPRIQLSVQGISAGVIKRLSKLFTLVSQPHDRDLSARPKLRLHLKAGEQRGADQGCRFRCIDFDRASAAVPDNYGAISVELGLATVCQFRTRSAFQGRPSSSIVANGRLRKPSEPLSITAVIRRVWPSTPRTVKRSVASRPALTTPTIIFLSPFRRHICEHKGTRLCAAKSTHPERAPLAGRRPPSHLRRFHSSRIQCR